MTAFCAKAPLSEELQTRPQQDCRPRRLRAKGTETPGRITRRPRGPQARTAPSRASCARLRTPSPRCSTSTRTACLMVAVVVVREAFPKRLKTFQNCIALPSEALGCFLRSANGVVETRCVRYFGWCFLVLKTSCGGLSSCARRVGPRRFVT